MAFLDRLREFLLLVQKHPSAPAEPDYERCRRYVIECFERAEAIAGNEAETLRLAYRSWSQDERLDALICELHWRLLSAPELAGFDRARLMDAGCAWSIAGSLREDWSLAPPVCVAFRGGDENPDISSVRRVVLEMLAADARHHVFRGAGIAESYWCRLRSMSRYALELGLVGLGEDGLVVTSVGKAFLRLGGREAARMLLHLETQQSSGATDPWRVSREAATCLLQSPGIWSMSLPSVCTLRSIERLQDMELVDALEPDSHRSPNGHKLKQAGELTSLGRELLKEVTDTKATQFRVVVQALLADRTVESFSKEVRVLALHSAAAAGEGQLRMFSHEIRSKLIPIKSALTQFSQLMRGKDPSLDKEIDRALLCVDISFTFIRESIELNKHLTQPPEPFSVPAVVRDAVAHLYAEVPSEKAPHIAIRNDLQPSMDVVPGYQRRFLVALVNILRNASQISDQNSNRPATITIGLDHLEMRNGIRITIDDDGPGVPDEQKSSIFVRDVSYRKDGMGQGLSTVKQIIEQEMSGSVHCEDSPNGGARFIIKLYGSR